jgi:chemotaxis protein MotB
MAGLSRRADRNTHIWPGFVDALATLLMVIMFLLLIFVLAQFFMSEALSGRDQALTKLKSQVSELADLLSLERKSNQDMRQNLSQMSEELQISVALRDDLKTSVSDLRKRENAKREELSAMTSVSETLRTDLAGANTQINAQLTELSKLGHDVEALKALKAELETEISTLARNISVKETRLDEKDALIDEMDTQLSKLSENVEAKETEISKLAETVGDKEHELESVKSSFLEEQELSESARAEVALLNRQMSVLRQQLAKIQDVLDASERKSKEQNAQIANLGKRLNAALASKVQELSRYRSEFFGRLRDMMGKRDGVRVVGDRFVFQSEVLFTKGSSDLGIAGKLQLDQLATTMLEIAIEIPGEIDWIMRIDGHTDADPISTAKFPSNWELSTARAISVVKHLTEAGLPANRLVAAGFGQFHPLDKRGDEIAKRRNRRIELKLTQR